MDKEELAQDILEFLGNRENIEENTTCMTRLRVKVFDFSKVNLSELKKVDGVLGVVCNGNLVQIVLGAGKVDRIGKNFSELTKLSLNESRSNDNKKVDIKNEDIKKILIKNKKNSKNNGKFQLFFQKIANIFVPLLPAIIAAGLLQGVTNTIDIVSSNFQTIWWYQLVKTISWISFTYLPIFVGINATKEFGGTAILGGIIGALFVQNENMPILKNIGNIGNVILPTVNKNFYVGAGGLFSALLVGFFVAFVEKNVRKIVPDILSKILTPVFTLIICGIIAILVILPLGEIITKILFLFLNFIYNKTGIISGFVISACFLPLVSMGLHQALIPIHILLNDPLGATKGINYFLPIIITAGGGQVGAGVALYIKTKNKKLKKILKDVIPAGILGMGEPLMYGVTLPLKKPFVTACLGSGFGGIAAVMLHLGTITQGVSGLLALLIVIPGSQLLFLLTMFFSYLGGFVLTYFWGVDEGKICEIYGEVGK